MEKSKSNKDNNFDDIWQGILPGLVPLPQSVTNFSPPENDITSNTCAEEMPPSPPLLKNCNKETVEKSETEVLSEILTYESFTLEFLRKLYRKSPKHIGQKLPKLIEMQRAGVRKARAVYFIKTGHNIPEHKSCPYISSIPHALRNLYLSEHERLIKYRALIDTTENEQLRSLYIHLSETKTISITIIEKTLASIIS